MCCQSLSQCPTHSRCPINTCRMNDGAHCSVKGAAPLPALTSGPSSRASSQGWPSCSLCSPVSPSPLGPLSCGPGLLPLTLGTEKMTQEISGLNVSSVLPGVIYVPRQPAGKEAPRIFPVCWKLIPFVVVGKGCAERVKARRESKGPPSGSP